MMPENYLGRTHRYFNLSDYEVDPHSRYRKRIFHEGPPSLHTQPANSDHPQSFTSPRDIETDRNRHNRGERRHDKSTDGYATDSSYTELPPMSPVSSGTSVYEGIETVGDDMDGPPISDRERVRSSDSARLDLKGEDAPFSPRPLAVLSPKPPTEVRPSSAIPSNPPILPNIPFASSSIAQYSNDRLAERARLASLPTRSPSPGKVQPSGYNRVAANHSIRVHPSESKAREKPDRSHHTPSYDRAIHAETSILTRARRATVSWPAGGSQANPEQRQAKRKPEDEPLSTATPEVMEVKAERASPPPLDLKAPEQPYSAAHARDSMGGSTSTASDAGHPQSRKRSKSAAYTTKAEESAESDQTTKRAEKTSANSTLKIALECGDYDQLTDHSWFCKVHHENLGGPRSVTRHHESVHLNIMVECEYCNGRFSRRDAMLRHQRQSGCKVRGKG